MKAPEVVRQNEGVRVVARTAAELFQEGLDEDGKYAGGKWGGLYLRAPDIYFHVLEKAGDKLVRLSEVAEVRRGFTTGANDFFYLEPRDLSVKEVVELMEQNPLAPVLVRNGAGWEGEIEAACLRPVIKSPREIQTTRIRLEDLSYLVFMPPKDVRKALKQGIFLLDSYPKAVTYISWGEQQGFHKRSTCAGRNFWWYLGEQVLPGIVWPMIHNDRTVVGILTDHILVDHNLFVIYSKKEELLDGKEEELLAAILSASLQTIAREFLGRSNLGEGGLKTEGTDILRLPILHPSKVDLPCRQQLLATFSRFSQNSIRSIFEELGFPLCRERGCNHPEHPYEHVQPELLTLDRVQEAAPDRFELDRVIFDILELTDEERLEVYRAVASLVKERLVRAKGDVNEG